VNVNNVHLLFVVGPKNGMRSEEERGEKSRESSHNPFLTSINSITKQPCARAIVILGVAGSGWWQKWQWGELRIFRLFVKLERLCVCGIATAIA